jgi:hypothetical protein
MKTKTINVYSFDELSNSAKSKAIDNWRNNNYESGSFWASENRQSMEKFAELFPIKIIDWSYGGRGEGVYFRFTDDYNLGEMSGLRLAKFIWNNYKSDIYTYKYYSICNGRKNCVGIGSKSRHSKIQLEEFGCPFTGFYMDNEILAPLFDFMRKPSKNTTFKDLLDECFEAWIKACNDDTESQNSDESITETIQANEYEFDESGNLL